MIKEPVLTVNDLLAKLYDLQKQHKGLYSITTYDHWTWDSTTDAHHVEVDDKNKEIIIG